MNVQAWLQVHLRFCKHHGQGVLLDFRRSVETHSIHTLKQLGLPGGKRGEGGNQIHNPVILLKGKVASQVAILNAAGKVLKNQINRHGCLAQRFSTRSLGTPRLSTFSLPIGSWEGEKYGLFSKELGGSNKMDFMGIVKDQAKKHWINKKLNDKCNKLNMQSLDWEKKQSHQLNSKFSSNKKVMALKFLICLLYDRKHSANCH